MANFKEIDQARKILGLDKEATMKDIEAAYRSLSLKYHPDKCHDDNKRDCEEMIKKINHAKDIIMTYCSNYRFSFKEEEVKRNLMDKEFYKHLQQFYDGWWGDLDF